MDGYIRTERIKRFRPILCGL